MKRKLGKYDKVCAKCGQVIKGAIAEKGGESSCWDEATQGWFHHNCAFSLEEKTKAR